MQHFSIATFAALLFFAGVYCSPVTPNEESSALHLSELEHPEFMAHISEDALRQKRQTREPQDQVPKIPLPIKERRDVNSVNANEELAEAHAPEGTEGPEGQRGKRQLFYSFGYPAFAPITYPSIYSPFMYFI